MYHGENLSGGLQRCRCDYRPIGIVSADSLLGEITPEMAVAIGQSKAMKLAPVTIAIIRWLE